MKYSVVGAVNTLPLMNKVQALKNSLFSQLPKPAARTSKSKANQTPVKQGNKLIRYVRGGAPRWYRIERSLNKLMEEIQQLGGEIEVVKEIKETDGSGRSNKGRR